MTAMRKPPQARGDVTRPGSRRNALSGVTGDRDQNRVLRL